VSDTIKKAPYRDLHQHLAELNRLGLLVTVNREINKDTELHPLVRWQFRGGIAEPDRKAFLFTNVTDSKGKHYDIPVVVGALAASRKIYSVGMDCALADIGATWTHAMAHPVAPQVVTQAPCQEIVIQGDELDEPGKGLDGIPLPISTPGWDNAPYTTLSQYISKDPDSGIQNMGIYRGQRKPTRHLRPLGKGQSAWRKAAGGGDSGLPALCGFHLGAKATHRRG
jgi:UbiD family decarboxylase